MNLDAFDSEWPAWMYPACRMVSWNPSDAANAYCGRCHDFTGRPRLPVTGNCDGCAKGVAIICVHPLFYVDMPAGYVINYFCAECGQLLLRVTTTLSSAVQ